MLRVEICVTSASNVPSAGTAVALGLHVPHVSGQFTLTNSSRSAPSQYITSSAHVNGTPSSLLYPLLAESTQPAKCNNGRTASYAAKQC